jgi:cell division protein FtsB
MKKVKEIFLYLKSHLNKYWIAGIIAFVLTFLVGESSIFNRISYDRQIRELEQEIDFYTQQKEENEQRLNALRNDNEGLERLAREKYLMTRPNEDLFIIEE